MIILSWQTGVARARFEGYMRHLAEAVSAESYSLHHYLYDQASLFNMISCLPPLDPLDPPVKPPCGRAFSTSENMNLANHYSMALWRRTGADSRILLPKGWSIVHLVGDTGDNVVHNSNNDNIIFDGVVVLRPSDDIVNGPVWNSIIRSINEKISSRRATDETDLAVIIAESANINFNRSRDTAVLASQFSRLDNNALLRSPHPGHPALPMQTSINMNNRSIINMNLDQKSSFIQKADIDDIYPNVNTGLIANNIEITGDLIIKAPDPTDSRQYYLEDPNTDTDSPLLPQSVTVLSSPCDPNNPPCDSSTVTVTDKVTVSGSIHASDIEISGTSIIANMTACIDPQEDLCDGGELEILDLKDGSSLSNVQVFATTTVDPSVIDPPSTEDSTITTIRALTGVIDEIEQGQMTVNGCFRSVTPYAYGARC